MATAKDGFYIFSLHNHEGRGAANHINLVKKEVQGNGMVNKHVRER